MGAFSQVLAGQSRKAARAVLLPPSAFADTWADKPDEPVLVGVRIIGEGDMMEARGVAARTADKFHPGSGPHDDVWIEAFNQSLMHYAIATATCHPDNAAEPFWDMAYDVVPCALSEGGALRLFDEIETLKVTESPLAAEATAEELQTLATLIQSGDLWEGMGRGDVSFCRRLLRRVLEHSAGARGVTLDLDDDD